MDFIEKMVERFLRLNRKMKRWQRAVSILGAIVVFASTYSLVLPAITLDKDTATTQAGVEIAASENDPSEDGTVFEAEAEEPEAEEEAEPEEEEASATDSGSEEAEEAGQEEAAPSEDAEAEETAAPEEEADVAEDAPAAGEEEADVDQNEAAPSGLTEEAAIATTEEAPEEGLITEDTQLVYEGSDYTVYADFGASAKLPVGVALSVKEITEDSDPEAYQAYYEKALEEVQNKYDDFTMLSFAKFYDISFVFEGAEVEPSGDVKVRIEYENALDVAKDTAVDAIHFDKNDEEKAEVIDSDYDSETNGKDEAVKAVEFESDKFSVYGVVGTETIETQVITADGDTFTISVTYGPEAGIPKGSWLTAREIAKGTSEYNDYLAQAQDVLGIASNDAAPVDEIPVEAEAAAEDGQEAPVNPFHLPMIAEGEYEEEDVTNGMVFITAEEAYQEDITFARFFDIKIMNADGEVEPEAPVEVKIEYVDPVEVSSDEALKAVHFGKDETEVTDIESDDEAVTEMVFTQNGFSVTGTVVTSGGNWPTSGQQYVMYFSQNDTTYAIKHDGSLVEVLLSNNRLTFPKAIEESEIGDCLWTYSNSGGNTVYNTADSVYLDPRSNIGVSTNSIALSRRGNGRIYATDNNIDYYIGSNGTYITTLGADQANDAVQIQFANAFAVDPHVTIHFVDREGNPYTDVNYNGQNPTVVKNTDGTFVVPYSWGGESGTVNLDTQFKKDGYTYASSHLAGHSNAKNKDLTYDGLAIDAALVERNNVLYFYSDIGHAGGSTIGYGTLPEIAMNSAVQTRTTTNGNLEDFAPQGNKDVYVIMDPAGPGGAGSSGSIDDLDVEDPIFKKTMEPNYDSNGPDGTYELSLSVTGKAGSETTKPKTNVVFVVDTSSSMDQYHTGPNDSGPTRLEDTQEALKRIAGQLLANNSQGAADTVELAMVSFDGESEDDLGWTTSLSDFEDAVDELDVHRGTNWEDGLKLGYEVATAKKAAEPKETTFVIFFTDGEGSQYTNFNGRDNWDSHDTTAGYGYWYSYFLCRESAKDECRAIVRDGIRLYGIYAYNSSNESYNGEKGEDLLHNAIKYGYDTVNSLDGERFFNAKNTDDLNDAFAKILVEINSTVGFTEIEMNDSITELTSVGLSLIGGGTSPTGFTYWRSGGSYVPEQVWADAPKATYDPNTGVQWKLDKDANNNPIVLEDGVTYTVKFTIWPSQEAYDWVSDLNNGFRTWYEAQLAGVDRQILRSEIAPGVYHYELKSNPDSYDAEGNIINNAITYKKVSTQTMDELPPGATIGTTTDPDTGVQTTYTQNPDGTFTRTVVTPKTTAFGPPDKNMPLEDTHIGVEKEWVVGLDDTQLVEFLYDIETGESKLVKVRFDIIQLDRTDHPYDNPYNTIYLGWQGDPATGAYEWADATHTVNVEGKDYQIGTMWEEEMDIAVGVMLDETQFLAHGLDPNDSKYIKTSYNGKTYYILETGHDYEINEPPQIADDFRFDFETQPYHPMLVNGVLKNVIRDSSGAITSILPEGDIEPLSSFLGRNILRGEINLKKLLQDMFGNPIAEANIPDDQFTFDMTVTNSREGALSGVDILYYTVDGNKYHDDDFNYYTEDEAIAKWGDDAEDHINILTPNSDGTSATATFAITGKQTVKIIDVPAGSQYSFTETVHQDYVFIQATRKDGTAPTQTFTVDPVNGRIVPNAASFVEYTNRQKPSYEVIILKQDQSGEPLEGAKFNLYTEEEWAKPEDQRTPMFDQDLESPADGKFSLGMLKRGKYYLVETVVPLGYLKIDKPIEITVDPDSTMTKNGLPLLVTYKQDGNAASENNDGVTITTTQVGSITTYIYTLDVINKTGVELPYTGGPGTFIYTLSGLMMIIAAAMMYGFRMRRRERRLN